MHKNNKLTISFVGDMMLGGIFSEKYSELKNHYLPKECFDWIKSDLVFANLEAPASNSGPPQKNKILVYSKTEPLNILKEMGVSFVNLANNHMMDYGYSAVEETKEYLSKLGIKYGGCGKNLSEAREAVFFEVKSHTISLHCYSWTKEFNEPTVEAKTTSPGVAPINYDFIAEDIRKAKKNGSNFIIISLHWGEGKSHYPRPEQIKLARDLIDHDVDLIIGHHPHCLQGFELYKNKPIFYSVGNFISSAYIKDEHSHLNYDNEGILRIRYTRERKTAIFKVSKMGSLKSTKQYKIEYMPLIQDIKYPIMLTPDYRTKKNIDNILRNSSRQLQKNIYPSLLFPILRRLDELKRIVEDYQDEGLKKEFLHPRTFSRIVKKIIKGKNFS